MCGIVALWDPGVARPARRAEAERLSRELVHRGPDGEGTWEADEAAAPLVLSHRRLAIRGLGLQGAQPMSSATSTLAFNGELFGVEPLRADLNARGVAFRGTSDTEILLAALDQWGLPAALPRIQGQFAFLWWSARERRLFLARDRLGIRPVYWSRSQDRFAAASEQKALLLLPWVEAKPSIDAMLRFLAMGRTDDVPEETMLSGIRSLPAGHWASWDGRALTVARYDRIADEPEAPEVEPAIYRLRSELDRAVDEQLVSDVPVGATVSGGLDSSTVVVLADRARIARGDRTTLHLFAYHDDGAEADERMYQRAVIESVRSPHEVHWVSSRPADLASGFDRYVHHQEEPYADMSSYAEYCLAAEAQRSGVKVLLSGLGGDEVFVGYPSFFGPLLLDVLRHGEFGAARSLISVAPDVLGRSGGYSIPVAAAVYHSLPSPLRNAWSALRNARVSGLGPKATLRTGAGAWRDWHRHDGQRATNAALRGAIESWCIPRFLLHSDRMGLAYGVEGRVPLLDDGVIRAAFAIPPGQRVGSTGLKGSLRRAVADVLPKPVLERRWKLGFHAPLPIYVAALDEPLRTGHRITCEVLGDGPKWAALPPGARWRWGALGRYLGWAREQKSRPAG